MFLVKKDKNIWLQIPRFNGIRNDYISSGKLKQFTIAQKYFGKECRGE